MHYYIVLNQNAKRLIGSDGPTQAYFWTLMAEIEPGMYAVGKLDNL